MATEVSIISRQPYKCVIQTTYCNNSKLHSAIYRIRQNIRAGKLSRLQEKTPFAGKVSRFLCGREGLATRDYVHCYCKNIHGKTFAEG